MRESCIAAKEDATPPLLPPFVADSDSQARQGVPRGAFLTKSSSAAKRTRRVDLTTWAVKRVSQRWQRTHKRLSPFDVASGAVQRRGGTALSPLRGHMDHPVRRGRCWVDRTRASGGGGGTHVHPSHPGLPSDVVCETSARELQIYYMYLKAPVGETAPNPARIFTLITKRRWIWGF